MPRSLPSDDSSDLLGDTEGSSSGSAEDDTTPPRLLYYAMSGPPNPPARTAEELAAIADARLEYSERSLRTLAWYRNTVLRFFCWQARRNYMELTLRQRQRSISASMAAWGRTQHELQAEEVLDRAAAQMEAAAATQLRRCFSWLRERLHRLPERNDRAWILTTGNQFGPSTQVLQQRLLPLVATELRGNLPDELVEEVADTIFNMASAMGYQDYLSAIFPWLGPTDQLSFQQWFQDYEQLQFLALPRHAPLPEQRDADELPRGSADPPPAPGQAQTKPSSMCVAIAEPPASDISRRSEAPFAKLGLPVNACASCPGMLVAYTQETHWATDSEFTSGRLFHVRVMREQVVDVLGAVAHCPDKALRQRAKQSKIAQDNSKLLERLGIVHPLLQLAQAEFEQFGLYMKKATQATDPTGTPLTSTPASSIAPPTQEDMDLDREKRPVDLPQPLEQPAKWAKGEAKGETKPELAPPQQSGKGSSGDVLAKAAAAPPPPDGTDNSGSLSGQPAPPTQASQAPTPANLPHQRAHADQMVPKTSSQGGWGGWRGNGGRNWGFNQGRSQDRDRDRRGRDEGRWNQSDRDKDREMEELREMIRHLARLALRLEDAMSICNLAKKESDPTSLSLSQPLRSVLFYCVWASLLPQLRKMEEATEEEFIKEVKSRGLTEENSWLYLKWDNQAKKHQKDTQEPLEHVTAVQLVQQIMMLCTYPDTIGRFHALRPLTSNLTSDVIPFMLTLQNRTQESHQLYTCVRRLCRNSCTHLVGMTLRPSRLGRSPLAQQIDRESQWTALHGGAFWAGLLADPQLGPHSVRYGPWLQGPNGMAHRPSGGSSPSKSRLSRDADATPTRISPSPKLLTLGGGGRSPSASPIGTELPAIDVTFRGSASPRSRKPPHATHFPVVRRADASARTPSTSSSQGPMSLGLHGRRVSAGTATKETTGIPHEILARGDRAQRKFREALAKGKAQPRQRWKARSRLSGP
ncbi:hypothetical protein AK812_SmicGene14564 [Symbiodinium microadriaticum]|uniref:Uncharacterized protein n=1 Tax=Symbiodinium microadriaticum TaxID=2951 RepID=A0A1Q9E580_SYMMI|nr:hypothetical protein AK812_SmicGene14564 [Symbiodinium microadriaticum]